MCADYATIILIVPAEKVNRTGRKFGRSLLVKLAIFQQLRAL
jgi:hypothetical protein